MIFTLLAAQFGAAQDGIVVYEGAKTNHFVESHSGSEYDWNVYSGFNPDLEADPEEYYFTTDPTSGEVSVRWVKLGLFYLKVTETDLQGCTNLKALPVSVLPNNRLFGFVDEIGNACFNLNDNSFELPINIFDNKGSLLDAEYFPIQIEFLVNNQNYSQVLNDNMQVLQISEDWFNTVSDANTEVSVELLRATDRDSAIIQIDDNRNTYVHTIYTQPKLEFETDHVYVYQGMTVEHVAGFIIGETANAEYNWDVIPENGTSTNIESIRKNTALVLWDGPPGNYILQATAVDGNGCLSDTITQQIEIRNSADIIVSAGRDTILGNNKPYQLNAEVEKQEGLTYTYLWQPDENLDDATSATPVFTPGNSTVFVLTVTNNLGITVKDSVEITVSELTANAGDDVYMELNSSVILDGSASIGTGINYKWTSVYGTIDSGENTAHPIVSGFGTYYLEITDSYGGLAIDSLNVHQLAHAPVANDDYDTTRYLTEVKIPVLNNDTDLENSIVPATLTITLSPFNGTAYVDFNDYTIHYRPNENFSGTDDFEYQVCNKYDECDKANVYVLVSDFKFLIPEAFSPNGDGINDYFEILGIDYYEGNSISIINRWGNKVYEAKNYGISTTPLFWDGKSNTGFKAGNEELPTGTYYYILNLGNGEKSIAGSIYLDR